MALTPGISLGAYAITAKIGEGGMGEVYRARDTKLDRDVALKVLPPAFTDDPDRVARFEREAKVLASLNHPNIGGIYGLEESGGVKALVLELVEGPTLADRIAQGPIPVDEALPIANQIAEALEAAHEQGIIHRDLKPANIKLRPDGTVKVLDFGLARAFQPDAVSGDASLSPTLTAAATQAGVIMGTAAYMAPEQAKGKPVDKRADVWGFGVVLYEMLTGGGPFPGDSVSEVLASVLKTEPAWSRLPRETPESVRRLLRRCLSKETKTRIGDVGVARLEIEDALVQPLATSYPEPRVRPSRAAVWVAMGAALGALVIGVMGWSARSRATDLPPPTRVEISLPADQQLVVIGLNNPVAISPDGRSLAFVGRGAGGRLLYLRAQDAFAADPVPGTEGALFPFFSPDGQWLGFFAGGELHKVAVTGGAPLTICRVHGAPYGASWGPDAQIVFAVPESGLWIVPDVGGDPTVLTELNPAAGDAGHILPHVLPDGSGVVFTQLGPGEPNAALWSQDAQAWTVILTAASGANVLPSGHLVYARHETVLAAPFDVSRRAVSGPARPVEDGVYTSTFGVPYFAVSHTGTLTYVPARAEDALLWVDRNGVSTPAVAEREAYEHPRVSPDGRRIAVDFGPGDNRQVWIYETDRGTRTPLTTEGVNVMPLWTPDGERVVYASTATGQWELFWRSADGSGAAEPLLEAPHLQWPTSFSPDGLLAYYEVHPETARDLWTVRPGAAPQPFLVTPFNEAGASFSPDGRWIAYGSDRSGRMEVYVRPFPGPDPPAQVSTDGGIGPLWGPHGEELWYRRGQQVVRVSVQTGPALAFGVPEVMFEGAYDVTTSGDPHYSATPDRQRFLMVTEKSPATLRLVLDWLGTVGVGAPSS